MNARRDWGHARDFAESMWKIMQHETPEDFVLATGESHSVRDFAEAAFAEAGMVLTWCGECLNRRRPKRQCAGARCGNLHMLKTRRLFPDYEPTPFLEGLEKTVRWYLANKEAANKRR